jgi:hypothetical protein
VNLSHRGGQGFKSPQLHQVPAVHGHCSILVARHSLLSASQLELAGLHQRMIRSSMVPTSNGELPSLMAICLVGAAVMSYGMYTFLHPFCTIWPACTRGSSSARLYSQCSDT